MSLFRTRQPKAEARSFPLSHLLPGSALLETPTAGESVTLDSALMNVAFGACRRVLVTEVTQLPIHTYRKRGDRREKIDNPPIVDAPSSMLTRRAWTAQVMDSLVRAGNAYLRATDVDMATGRLVKAETISPTVVAWEARDGVLRPTINGKTQTLWPLGDFIHIPATAFITAGLPVAMSPVEMAREQISADTAAQRYVSNWYGGGGHPTRLIYADQELTAAQAAAIKAAWIAATEGRAPAVLGAGLKTESVQEAPSADGFLDQMRFAVEQACRVTGVPPSMVYAAVSGSSVTYANVTDADLHFLKHSLGTWLGDLEDHITSWTNGPEFVKFNVDALLRVTPRERHEIYKIRLDSRTMTVDEVRNLEDETPFGGEFAEPAALSTSRDLSAVEAIQKIYLGVGSVITAEEARRILNESVGTDLDPAADPTEGASA